jgi:hypothetical protein
VDERVSNTEKFSEIPTKTRFKYRNVFFTKIDTNTAIADHYKASDYFNSNTKVSSLKKGELRGLCNVTACQCDISQEINWKHRLNGHYYCQPHAFRINDVNMGYDGKELCERVEETVLFKEH